MILRHDTLLTKTGMKWSMSSTLLARLAVKSVLLQPAPATVAPVFGASFSLEAHTAESTGYHALEEPLVLAYRSDPLVGNKMLLCQLPLFFGYNPGYVHNDSLTNVDPGYVRYILTPQGIDKILFLV